QFVKPRNIAGVNWPECPATRHVKSPACSPGKSPPRPKQSPDSKPPSMTLRKRRKKRPKPFSKQNKPSRKSAFGNSMAKPVLIQQISKTPAQGKDSSALKRSQNFNRH